MYPRNSASPERIAIGQVVLISDGTIQSSGVTITVRGQGGAEATGGGTTAFGADNTVYYTPTQAETNFTSFVVIASKASCFSVSQTIITTASSVAGQVDVKSIAGTDQTANDNGADINAILTDTAEIGVAGAGLTNLGGSGNNWNVGKTGYTLASTGLDAIASTATGMIEIAKAVWDRVLSAANHNIANSAGRRLRTLQTGGNYEGGQVWVDTVNGTAGTTVDENGVVNVPVLTWADALTLAAAIPLKAFHIANGSTVTLSAASENYVIDGHEWNLVLNGQSVASTMVIDANVSGTGTGAESEYDGCIFAITSLPAMQAYGCSFTATTSGGFTMSTAGNYRFVDCQSGVAGSGAPLFTLGTGAITAEFRRWSGGITISGISADDTLTVGGEMGTITLNGADGTIEIRGTYKAIVDNRTGSPTLNTDGAIKGADVASILTDTNDLQTNQGNWLTVTGHATEAKQDIIDANVDAILVDTGTTIPASIAALNDISVADVLTTQMTEAYAADGVAPTLAQALFLIQQSIGDFSISGTTLTVKQLDGSTTAATYTLDDGTNPTSRTRAT